MKPTFPLLITSFFCLIFNFLAAQPVDINMAKRIAETHLTSIYQSKLKSASSNTNRIQFTSVKATVQNNDTLYYILNDTINKGFVIVSADKRAWPILGYSTEGYFDEMKQPDAFKAWMQSRKQEIESIKKNNLHSDEKTIDYWNQLSLKNAAIETSSVEPLIKTKWDQGCFFNEFCPSDAAGPCGHAFTGCTITAMAQIMKYWNYPTQGIGSHTYSHPIYGNLSADFGSTTYRWSEMPNSLTSPNDAVAILMYHCGVSLDTEYGPISSGAWDPRDELVQYFNYSSRVLRVDRSAFKTSEWINILKSELNLSHPIWYTGGSLVNHSFICDGYQDFDYFHFNWGWGGSNDGYFYIDNLNPNGFNFNEDEYALINIVPGNLPDGYTGLFLSDKSVVIDTNGGATSVDICSSSNWTVTSNQSWLKFSANTGISGKTTLTLTAGENLTGSDRSDTITVSATGFSNQKIAVNQFPKMNVTPGSLYELISKCATSITKLTLHGAIDARDFKTMRDAMPSLTDIDLSDVSIAAYTGSMGTNGGVNICEYEANTIPPLAFTLSCNRQNLIKSIILPESVISIESQSFGSSKYLNEIKIPSQVSNISSHAFRSCSALINVDQNNQDFSTIDGVLFNKNQTTIIHYPTSKAGSYMIPNTVNCIGSNAFEYCNELTNVIIPSSVSIIDFFAFFNCSGLINVFIPSNVTTIQREAFDGCSGLINVDPKNPNYSSIDGVLFNKVLTTLIQCPTSKKGIYSIPLSVTSVGKYAFSACSGLTSILIPTSVSSIELSAFQACKGLTNVVIPATINTIEYATFYSCSELKSITIPSSVISIENWALGDCNKLNTICILTKSPPRLDNSLDVFTRVNKTNCNLNVPYGSKTAYQAANQWQDFKNIVEMPGFILSETAAILKADKGSSGKVEVSCNVECSVSSDKEWLKATIETIDGKSVITFEASENSSKENRSAVVTVSADSVESQTITVLQNGSSITGIDQLSSTDLMIYPNPTSGKIKIISNQIPQEGNQLVVSDINGKIVLRKHMSNREDWVDLNGNPSGVYFITTDLKDEKSLKVILSDKIN